MRHLKKGRKFGRTRDQRKALLRNIAHHLIEKGRLVTTLAKAKELRPRIEKAITKAKENNVARRRELLGELPAGAVQKLMSEIAPKYKARNGGYTRIIKLGPRKSDASKMAIIELIK